MRLLLGLLMFWGSITAQASELTSTYDIRLDATSYKSRKYDVVTSVTITNHATSAIDELVWLLYPNRYKKKLPNVDDINHHMIYPNGYSKGFLDIVEIEIDHQKVSRDHIQILDEDRFGEVFVKLSLDAPLEVESSVTIRFVSKLKVPKKYGSFGWFRNQLTMSGGWSPVLLAYENGEFRPTYQMPLADWNVQIKVPKPYQVVLPQSLYNEQNQSYVIAQKRQVSLLVGDMKHFETKHEPFDFVIYHHERRDRNINVSFDQLIDNFTTFLHEKNIDRPFNYTLAQAPLREMLVVDGSPVSFYSDRAFKVIKPLHHYHEIPIYKSLFMQLYEDQVSKIESDQDLFWVQEVVAWRLTDELVKSLDIKHRDARQIGFLQMFKFLPLIDRVLYTPQFAFYDVFYNLV
ncbi:MAG: hypothetical protein KDD46_03045 [Bdellovibrionales bacterium]|nr:hypothetical protein [Bdellovibrionales bacterium]